MQPEDVKLYIEHYKEYVVRVKHLKNEIKDLRLTLERIKIAKVADLVNITQKWSVMPHGTNVGDPTGQAAEKIIDGEKSQELKQLEWEIQGKEEEMREKTMMIKYVNAWLQILNERENFVIQSKCIDGFSWDEIVDKYQKKFDVRYSPNGLKKIRNRALSKICKIAK